MPNYPEFKDLPKLIRKNAKYKTDFHSLGGPLGGAYILDQSAHHLMEGVAAVLAGRK